MFVTAPSSRKPSLRRDRFSVGRIKLSSVISHNRCNLGTMSYGYEDAQADAYHEKLYNEYGLGGLTTLG